MERHEPIAILRRQGTGYSVEGPGFYVWDEDPSEVVRVASELRGGNLSPRPCQRMLVIPSGQTNQV